MGDKEIEVDRQAAAMAKKISAVTMPLVGLLHTGILYMRQAPDWIPRWIVDVFQE